MMAYMDDITIVGTDSHSIDTATRVLDDFSVATSALVSRNKSELFLKPCEAFIFHFPVRRDTIKLLGVTFLADRGGQQTWKGVPLLRPDKTPELWRVALNHDG